LDYVVGIKICQESMDVNRKRYTVSGPMDVKYENLQLPALYFPMQVTVHC